MGSATIFEVRTQFLPKDAIVAVDGNNSYSFGRYFECESQPVTSLHNPNFSEYAELCGAKGIRVNEDAELEGALSAAPARRTRLRRDHRGRQAHLTTAPR